MLVFFLYLYSMIKFEIIQDIKALLISGSGVWFISFISQFDMGIHYEHLRSLEITIKTIIEIIIAYITIKKLLSAPPDSDTDSKDEQPKRKTKFWRRKK